MCYWLYIAEKGHLGQEYSKMIPAAIARGGHNFDTKGTTGRFAAHFGDLCLCATIYAG